jgi:hypothetical protein
MTWDLPTLLPIREEGVLRIFITLKNPSPWPGFEPANFGSRGQRTNHHTTNATLYWIGGTKFLTFDHRKIHDPLYRI